MRWAWLLFVLAGCVPVQTAQTHYADCPAGTLCAYDIRTGTHWWQRILSAPHRLYAWRDPAGKLSDPISEEPSESNGLSQLSSPLNWGVNHSTIPLR